LRQLEIGHERYEKVMLKYKEVRAKERVAKREVEGVLSQVRTF
jgi:hypothetical protein